MLVLSKLERSKVKKTFLQFGLFLMLASFTGSIASHTVIQAEGRFASENGDGNLYLPIVMKDSGPASSIPVVPSGSDEYELTGRVVDNFNEPVEDALVTFTSTQQSLVIRTSTGSNGEYNARLFEGSYVTSFERSGYDFSGSSFGVTINGNDVTASTTAVLKYPTDVTLYKLSGKVIDEGGAPIEGALVRAQDAENDNQTEFVTVTDDNGVYEFHLESSTYRVNFDRSDFDFTGKEFDVNLNNQDFSAENTVAQRLIEDTTTFQVSGRLIDQDGNSIDEALVTAKNDKTQNETLTATDENGAYLLDLSNGNYTIAFARSGYAFSNADINTIISDSNQVLGDFIASESVTSETKFILSGSVVDEVNVPIEGVNVTASDGSTIVSSYATDENGQFTLELKNGRYDLNFENSEYDFTSANQSILLDGADQLMPAVSGAIIPSLGAEYSIVGRVVDENAQPLEYVQITIEPTLGGPSILRATDAEGIFTARIIDGSYNISFERMNYEFESSELVTIDGQNLALGDVTAEPSPGSVRVAQANTTYRIKGSVLDESGDPLEGVNVTAKLIGSKGKMSTDTKASGTYALRLENGSYKISFQKVGFDLSDADLTVTVNDSTQTLASVTGELIPSPSAKYKLAGELVDSNGDPLTNVTVTVKKADRTVNRSTQTSDTGRYTFRVKSGEYTVSFRKANHDFDQDQIPVNINGDRFSVEQVTGTDTTPPVVTHKVSGRVRDGDNKLLQDVTVVFKKKNGNILHRSRTTDANGSYTINLRDGEYIVSFAKTGYDFSGVEQSITVSGGDLTVSKSVGLKIPPVTEKHDVSGLILDDSGNRLEGVVVTVENRSGSVKRAKETNSLGKYKFSLPDGKYTLTFVKAGYDFSAEIINVKVSGADVSGNDATGQVIPPPVVEYKVTGLTADENDVPIEDVIVVAEQGGTSFKSAKTGSDGKFSLGLPKGQYTIKFDKSRLDFNESEVDINVRRDDINLNMISPKERALSLALGKPTEQSSTYSGASSDKAVDGELTKESTAKTKSENQPWWQVDIAGDSNQDFHIDAVTLFNPNGCCTASTDLNDAHIFVSNSDMSGKTFSQLRNDSAVYHVKLTGADAEKGRQKIEKIGRFVRVQLQGDNAQLVLAEVRVFGHQITNAEMALQISQSSARTRAVESTGEKAEFIVERFGDLSKKAYEFEVSSNNGSRSSEFEQLKAIALAESENSQTGLALASLNDYEIRDENNTLLTNSITFKEGQKKAFLVIQAKKDGKVEVPERMLIEFSEVPGVEISYLQSTWVRLLDDVGGIDENSRLFVGEYRLENGAETSASGYVAIRLSNNNAYAEVTTSYGGLTTPQSMTPETAAHIHHIDGSVIESLPIGQAYKYRWRIKGNGQYSDQEVLDLLLSGKLYANVHTARYPNGEIKADLNESSGTTGDKDYSGYDEPAYESLTNEELERDIYRFLTQATFGPTPELVDDLKKRVAKHNGNRRRAYEEWIDEQFSLESPSYVNYIESARIRFAADQEALANNPSVLKPRSKTINVVGSTHEIGDDGWLTGATYAKAQLRERMTFALSQIVVVGSHDLLFATELAVHHDNLNKHAFGSFEDLLYDVSKSAPMSVWLTYYQNRPTYEGNVLITPPDENYAREIMQLFSIGLLELHEDGTLKLGKDGLPVQSYTQKDISELARVFTGWSSAVQLTSSSYGDRLDPSKNGYRDNLGFNSPELTYVPSSANIFLHDWKTPLQNFSFYHDKFAKEVLGVDFPAGQSGEAELQKTVNVLSGHDNTAPFIAYRLIQRLTTSNPSPEYVYRVAQKFKGNSGEPDQLEKTIKQILLDPEARNLDQLDDYSTGKIQEPLLRVVAYCRVVRCDNNQSDDISKFEDMRTKYHYGYSDAEFSKLFDADAENVLINRASLGSAGQRPYKSPTVFNWFEPDYTEPGDLNSGGIVAPELQHYNEGTVTRYHNLMQELILTPGRIKLTSVSAKKQSPSLKVSKPQVMVDAYMDVMDSNGDGKLTPRDDAFSKPGKVKQATDAVLNVADLYFCGGRLQAESTGNENTDPYTIISDGLYEIYQPLDGKTRPDAAKALEGRINRAMYFVMVTPQCMVQK